MTSLKCRHGHYAGLCPECKQNIGAKTLGTNLKEWDKTWHALRLETHRRFATFVAAIHENGWTEDLYYTIYDKPAFRAKTTSYEEDPQRLNGAFYLALLKMTDITIDGKRIQGYNAESEWVDAKERLFERYAATEIPRLVASKRLLIHGGNSSWSNQQRAPQLVLSPHLWTIVDAIAFGEAGTAPDKMEDAEAVRRIQRAQRLAEELDVDGVSVSVCSKIFQCFSPTRWPVVNQRANATIAGKAGDELPEVTKPSDYLAFALRCRELARERGLPDLEMLDISFSNLYESGGGRTLGA